MDYIFPSDAWLGDLDDRSSALAIDLHPERKQSSDLTHTASYRAPGPQQIRVLDLMMLRLELLFA
jgi:hypothetical protein